MFGLTKYKFVRLIIQFLCLSGCLFQVFQILPNYLTYGVESELAIFIPEYDKPNDLSYCVRYVDVFDFDMFFKDKNISFNYDDNDPNEKRLKLSPIASVRDIMKYTPHADDLLAECYVIPPNSYQGKEYNASGCNERFEIVKYYLQEFICYRFHLKQFENDTYRLRTLKFALTRTGILFALSLKPTKVRQITKWMKVVVHESYVFPDVDVGLAPGIVNRFHRRLDSHDFKVIYISYFSLTITRLPPPYTSRCGLLQALGYRSRSECLNRCIRNITVTKFNKLPFSVIISHEENLNHISDNEIEARSKELIDIESQCNDRCFSEDCEEMFFVSRIATRGTDIKYFTIRYQIPREPVFSLTYVPLMSFTSFLVYILSTFGTWLGISMLGVSSYLIKSFKKNSVTTVAPVKESHGRVIFDLLHRIHVIEALDKFSVHQSAGSNNTLRLKTMEVKVDRLNENLAYTIERVNKLIHLVNRGRTSYNRKIIY